MTGPNQTSVSSTPELRETPSGLSLVGDGMELHVDFTHTLPRLALHKLSRELLVRVAKVKDVTHPTAIDATAGLGEDTLLLAAAGFSVTAFESNATIAALLKDGLQRAANHPDLDAIVERITVVESDSIEALSQGDLHADVVYLDPMFPERTKSAAVKKKFQLLHRLEQPCDNPEALLRAALQAQPRKVVIKRPLKGPYLANVKPAYSLSGKSIRYDCLVPANIRR